NHGSTASARARKSTRFIRIDSVHQGDRRGRQGLYHINAVDCVTQWEVVGSVPAITREYMLPLLRAMLAQFPFMMMVRVGGYRRV
ncbi:hypothetical protein BH160DRAFT_2305, partial [Burkholderia sp. H160]